MALVPHGPLYGVARAVYSPVEARYALTTRMTAKRKQELRELVERVRSIGRS